MTPFKPSLLSVINLLIVLLLIPLSESLAQSKSYDEVLYQAVVKTAGTDMTLAKKLADSLYRTSIEPIHKVKSLMLLSELNLTTGSKKEGISYAFQAEQLSADNNLYEWQARIYGFIASHYRSIGLKRQSRQYLDKSLEAINRVEDLHIVNQFKGLVYQEIALQEIESKHFKEAITILKKAEPCFKYIRNNELRLYQLASNFGQLGRAYLDLKDTRTAITNFKTALLLLSKIKSEATVVKGFMYEGIGRAFFEDKEFAKSKGYFDKALSIAVASKDISLNEEIYCDLAIYYMETGDKSKFKQYNNLFQAARENSVKVNKESSEVVVNRLEEKQKQIKLEHTFIFAGLGIVLLVLLGILVMSRAKNKKEYAKFQQIIENIQSGQLISEDKSLLTPDITSQLDNTEKDLMSKEVEQGIEEKLLLFEHSNAFTDRSLNLSVLSVMLETNGKYLSYVINKHKKKDFNNYINELRINYIIKKLESSPEYLNYKISYLAEECGFSSHSKFAEKFKSVTSMSPSSFIRFLHKEQQNKVA